MKNILFTDESVKRQITDSIRENLTDSDLESTFYQKLYQAKCADLIEANNFSLLCFFRISHIMVKKLNF